MPVGSSMNFTWVNTSVPAIAGARFVVSESGDILSPKYAPDMIAPAAIGAGMPSPIAIPMRARPIVPIVPHDVPVASAVIEQISTAATRNTDGDSSLRP